jgi:hypothetical protein
MNMLPWIAAPMGCPYHDNLQRICRASFSEMKTGTGKIRRCCGSEDHDRCGIFLSKVLRQSRHVYTGKMVVELTLK